MRNSRPRSVSMMWAATYAATACLAVSYMLPLSSFAADSARLPEGFTQTQLIGAGFAYLGLALGLILGARSAYLRALDGFALPRALSPLFLLVAISGLAFWFCTDNVVTPFLTWADEWRVTWYAVSGVSGLLFLASLATPAPQFDLPRIEPRSGSNDQLPELPTVHIPALGTTTNTDSDW